MDTEFSVNINFISKCEGLELFLHPRSVTRMLNNRFVLFLIYWPDFSYMVIYANVWMLSCLLWV